MQRFLLVGVLFGTTLQELLGEVLGLGCVSQIRSHIIVHLIRRVHLLQERRKCWNCKERKGGGEKKIGERGQSEMERVS